MLFEHTQTHRKRDRIPTDTKSASQKDIFDTNIYMLNYIKRLPFFSFFNPPFHFTSNTKLQQVNRQQLKYTNKKQRQTFSTCVAARTSSLDGFSLKMSLSASALYKKYPSECKKKNNKKNQTQYYTQCLSSYYITAW